MSKWYRVNKRDLPWRKTKDPYKVWVSEVILQQTRVNQGLSYYKNFLNNFPTINAFEGANETDILRVWQGLGYYSRVINMHRCAKTIVKEHKSQFPKTYIELLKLPGIGPYTAAAISSFCFGEKQSVIDGNVYRVLARIFGIFSDISKQSSRKKFEQVANKLISKDYPGLFNQAIMEYGALVCKPVNPKCSECIFQKSCIAFINKSIRLLPVKGKVVVRKNRRFNYIVYKKNDNFLMRKRTGEDIWRGLYDFYLTENIDSEFPVPPINAEIIGYKHILTHQIINANFYLIQVENERKFKQLETNLNMESYNIEEMKKLPKPKLIDRYLQENYF